MFSQTETSRSAVNRWVVAADMGYVFSNDRDEYFSNLHATGNGIAAGVLVRYKIGKARTEIDFRYNSADLRINAYKNFAVQCTGFSGSLLSLWDIKAIRSKSLSYAFGPFLNFFHTDRVALGLINYNSSFESAISLGIANEFVVLFGKKGDYILKERLNFSLASFYRRPGFVSSRSAESLSGEWKAATLDRCRLFRNELNLSRKWKQHSLGLGYAWNYYRINNDRGVVNASHCAQLIYSVSL